MPFRVVLSGRALPGHNPEQIAESLRRQLKLSPAQVQALLPPAQRARMEGRMKGVQRPQQRRSMATSLAASRVGGAHREP